jgi:hypothetical protein
MYSCVCDLDKLLNLFLVMYFGTQLFFRHFRSTYSFRSRKKKEKILNLEKVHIKSLFFFIVILPWEKNLQVVITKLLTPSPLEFHY